MSANLSQHSSRTSQGICLAINSQRGEDSDALWCGMVVFEATEIYKEFISCTWFVAPHFATLEREETGKSLLSQRLLELLLGAAKKLTNRWLERSPITMPENIGRHISAPVAFSFLKSGFGGSTPSCFFFYTHPCRCFMTAEPGPRLHLLTLFESQVTFSAMED